jgi:hypothetical protein
MSIDNETNNVIILEINEQPVPEKKITPNIWKQRSDAAALVVKPIIEDKPEIKQTLNPDKEHGKGFKKFEGKGRGKGYDNREGRGKGYGKGRGKGNTIYQQKEQTPEEKLFYENKTIAFEKAQAIAIIRCVNRCNLKIRDEINNSISHELNYKRTLVMDITDDIIMVEVEDNKYEYSFKRFLENRHFQNNVRDEYSKILPEAWVNLFYRRDEGTFCIGIQKRKLYQTITI